MDRHLFLNAVKLIHHSVYSMCDRDRVVCGRENEKYKYNYLNRFNQRVNLNALTCAVCQSNRPMDVDSK